MKKAFIVSSSADSAAKIAELLGREGFSSETVFSSGGELRRSIHSAAEPELVVIDAPLPDEFGLELALYISETTSAAVALICDIRIAADVREKASDAGVAAASKPLDRERFLASITTVCAARARMIGLKKENAGLLTKIDDMRLINRAKTALMKYLGFTEPQAHRYIEKQAMNARQPRREAAMRILASYVK